MESNQEIHILIPNPLEEFPENLNLWLTNFSEYLAFLLGKIMPVTSRISFHHELPETRGNQVMVFLISPVFLSDEAYVKKLEKLSLLIREKDKDELKRARIFKVCILPAPSEEQPQFLQNYTGYNLFPLDQVETESPDLKTFDRDIKNFMWSILVDLAYDISKSLAEYTAISFPVEIKAGLKTVFLAETTEDQEMNREVLKRELEQYGHQVIPGKHLPKEISEIEEVVSEQLSQSSLVIHLVGNQYGDLLEGKDYSLIDLQLRLSAKSGELPGKGEDQEKIIWLPPDLKPADEKQQLFIENLIRQEETEKVAEIVQTPLEALKSIVRKKLSGRESKSDVDSDITVPDEPFVYLIHEGAVSEDVEHIGSWFDQHQTQVISSGGAKAVKNVVSQHRMHLTKCEAVIIYYKGKNLPWINSKLKDLLKAPGLGRKDPFKAKAVVSHNKFDFDPGSYGIDTIALKDGILPDTFDKFLEKINQ